MVGSCLDSDYPACLVVFPIMFLPGKYLNYVFKEVHELMF